MPCDALRCVAMLCGAMLGQAMLCSVMQCAVVLCSANRCNAMKQSDIRLACVESEWSFLAAIDKLVELGYDRYQSEEAVAEAIKTEGPKKTCVFDEPSIQCPCYEAFLRQITPELKSQGSDRNREPARQARRTSHGACEVRGECAEAHCSSVTRCAIRSDCAKGFHRRCDVQSTYAEFEARKHPLKMDEGRADGFVDL
jgi:hypothetical protein